MSSTPVHPGVLLEHEMQARRLDLDAAARELGLDAADLAAILRGTAPVTAEVARKLARVWSGDTAADWTGRQARHDAHAGSARDDPSEHARRRALVTTAVRITVTPAELAAIEAWLAALGHGDGARAAGEALAQAARAARP